MWLIYSATACMSRKWQILVLVLWFTLPCLCVEVWLISLMVLGWYPIILWDLCLDWCACCLLCYALVRIKLISSRCLWELWYACNVYFVYCTSMHSHICIVTPHIGMLAETCEGCGIGAKPEDGRTGKCYEERCSPSGCHLTNTDLSQIPGMPRSIISLLLLKQLIIYVIYVLLH
jgi:hypothetical protein